MIKYSLVFISLFLLAFLLVIGPLQQEPPGFNPAHADELPVLTTEESRIYAWINQIRRRHGLAPLRLSATLRDFARSHSRDMADNGFVDHVDGEGRSFRERFARSGMKGWVRFGENVGMSSGYWDDAASIVSGWMKSKPHRKNILSGDFDTTGIGTALAEDGTLYATQVFSRSR
jgi:uncharacterized protein YkwD